MSYALRFRGPQLSCAEEKFQNFTVLWSEDDGAALLRSVFNSTWFPVYNTYRLSKRRHLGSFYKYVISNPRNASSDDDQFYLLVEQSELVCTTVSVEYNLNVSYVDGIQQMSYSIKDPKLLPMLHGGNVSIVDLDSWEDIFRFEPIAWGEKFDTWPTMLRETLLSWNEFTIAHSALTMMDKHFSVSVAPNYRFFKFTLENGTEVELRAVSESPPDISQLGESNT